MKDGYSENLKQRQEEFEERWVKGKEVLWCISIFLLCAIICALCG